MYRRVRPHKKFETAAGVEYNPIVTLRDTDGGLCHIVNDDGCYVCYLHTEESGFVPVVHIFTELHEALAELGPPNTKTEIE